MALRISIRRSIQRIPLRRPSFGSVISYNPSIASDSGGARNKLPRQYDSDDESLMSQMRRKREDREVQRLVFLAKKQTATNKKSILRQDSSGRLLSPKLGNGSHTNGSVNRSLTAEDEAHEEQSLGEDNGDDWDSGEESAGSERSQCSETSRLYESDDMGKKGKHKYCRWINLLFLLLILIISGIIVTAILAFKKIQNCMELCGQIKNPTAGPSIRGREAWVQRGEDIPGVSASLNINGTRIAVSSPSGHVTMYKFDPPLNLWFPMAQINISLSATNNSVVCLSPDGSRIAVASSPGTVQIYEEIDQATWNHSVTLIPWGEQTKDFPTISMSDNGTRIALGCPRCNTNGLSEAGKVFVYYLTLDGNWILMGGVIGGKGIRDYFGSSISLYGGGDKIAIGAPSSIEHGEGYAEVYHYTNSTWQILGMRLDGIGSGDLFGSSVSFKGDMVAVGASGASSISVFQLEGNNWVPVGNTISPDTDQIGSAASLSGDGHRLVSFGTKNEGMMSTIWIYKYGGNVWYRTSIMRGMLDTVAKNVALSYTGDVLATEMEGGFVRVSYSGS